MRLPRFFRTRYESGWDIQWHGRKWAIVISRMNNEHYCDCPSSMANPNAIATLNAAAAEVAEGGGLSLEDARRHLGWPGKEGK